MSQTREKALYRFTTGIFLINSDIVLRNNVGFKFCCILNSSNNSFSLRLYRTFNELLYNSYYFVFYVLIDFIIVRQYAAFKLQYNIVDIGIECGSACSREDLYFV